MITCPNCSKENDDTYKYCLACGYPLPQEEKEPEPQQPEMIDCPHCGEKVPSNFKFCGACGGPIAAGGSSGTPRSMESASRSPTGGAPPGGAAPAATPAAQRAPATAAPEETSRVVGDAQTIDRDHAADTVAELIVIRPDGSEGTSIAIGTGRTIIGRDSDNDTLSGDPFLSPEHAVIIHQSGSFLLRDLDSLNGVFYRIRGEVALDHGDQLRLGQELLRFDLMSRVEGRGEGDDGTLAAGSPDRGYWGRLSLISGPDVVTRAFLLDRDEINLGRETGQIQFREDGFVSGRHARITRTDGRVLLRDLGSSNGTYVRIHDDYDLEDGDLILMGQQLFRMVTV